MTEIRIPTYKRPLLLKRALDSLKSQTVTDWKAIVLDDSPEGEARNVVEQFAEARIEYHRNEKNVGGAENIDQAFRKEAFFSKSKYFAILEDDNWFEPTLIEANIEVLRKQGCNLLLRNQKVNI